MLMTRTRGVNVLFTPKKETRYVKIVCGFVPSREKVTKELTKKVIKKITKKKPDWWFSNQVF